MAVAVGVAVALAVGVAVGPPLVVADGVAVAVDVGVDVDSVVLVGLTADVGGAGTTIFTQNDWSPCGPIPKYSPSGLRSFQ